MSNLINSIRSFILTCPFLEGGRVNVDYIGEGMEYSIDPLPCDPIIQRYTDGGAKSNSSLLLPARRNMIRMPGSILKTVDFSKLLMSGWKNRALWGTSRNWRMGSSLF